LFIIDPPVAVESQCIREVMMTSTKLRGQISQAKKSGFSRNRFLQTYVSTRSWPPESPAKSYLKVSWNPSRVSSCCWKTTL